MIKDVLLNVLIILIPLVSFQLAVPHTYNEKKWFNPTVLFAIINGFSLFLCITFPVEMKEGYFFDFRAIPLAMSFLYGSYLVGFTTFGLYFIYRIFIIGTTGIFFGIVVSLAIILFCLLTYKAFHHGKLRKKIFLVIKMSLIIFLLKLARCAFNWHNWQMNAHDLSLMVLYLAVMIAAFALIIILVENYRNQQNKQMEQADKINSVGQLAASITHEVRNPMTVARGFMQIFQSEEYIPDDKKIFLNMMIQEIDRAQAIITDYLSIVKQDGLKIEQLNIKELIDSLGSVMNPFALLKGVELHYNTDQDLYIIGDQGKLKQVLMNIIKNAIEATPQGGQVTLSTIEYKNEVSIHIKDTGIGMTKEQLKKLGDPYFSTKPSGTGLGLTASYRIVEEMNGKINVESEPDKGTTFKLTFPKA
ncbi:sensor histidine kinase [Fictibacillus gelatini]|uniref:sensor histidine kinase n=1 Tax=Fictibacillus gelatini TaxID=225985 RepID=UPI00040419B4|nr:HAMP domain-containing sensor histidine kinase [Fictibacillus gelatini]